MVLDEIVALLSDQNASLEAALLKTKVLLHTIGHKELVPWVSNELTGYSEVAELPPYRIVSSQAHAHVTWGYSQDQDFVLPVYQLSDRLTEIVNKTKMTSSIGTIEQHVKVYREQRHGLVRHLPPEYASAYTKVLTPGTNIIKLWCAINMADVEGILIQVRSRLLDFCLELQSVVGVETAPQDLIKKAATVDAGSMFRTAIYNTGSGTIIVGSSNIQVNNTAGDIEGLIREVAKLGYEQTELDELRQAVVEDSSKNQTPTVTDGETSKWYLRALKKVGKGAVDAGVDVVSKVIVEALKHYASGI